MSIIEKVAGVTNMCLLDEKLPDRLTEGVLHPPVEVHRNVNSTHTEDLLELVSLVIFYIIRVRYTSVTNQRLSSEEPVIPSLRISYVVPPKEREAISQQVHKMHTEDVIPPLNSSLASSVGVVKTRNSALGYVSTSVKWVIGANELFTIYVFNSN